MKPLLFALFLLIPSPTQGSHISIPDAIKAAYEQGYEDAAYRDDIGLVKLSLKDVEEKLK